MNLYVLRHAIAVERGTPGYTDDDSKRPLTPEGRTRMQQIAQGMKALGLSFDLTLASPYIRAKETAAIVAQTFNIKKIHFTNNLVPEASFNDIIDAINRHKVTNILLVGHEPHLSKLVSFLLVSKNIPINLKKGGLCHLTVDGVTGAGSATLEWLLTPSQLRQAHQRSSSK